MDYYAYSVITVFCLYAGATHFIADFLANWRALKKRGGWFLVLHCFLYTLCFIPVFCWMKVNFLFLLPIFFSHLIIDWNGKNLRLFVQKYIREDEGDAFFKGVTLGLDQVFHLSVILIIAPFI